MNRRHIVALFAAVLAVPAIAATAGSLLSKTPESPCFVTGQTGYRLISQGRADYTIRVDANNAKADLLVELVNDPASADFVMVDDGDTIGTCDAVATVRTIKLDRNAAEPDLTIALTDEPGAGRIRVFAQSAGLRPQDAAAMFAVMWKSPKKRHLAQAARPPHP